MTRRSVGHRTPVVFFLGKGGVGKTTVALGAALDLSARGVATALVSLDSAHNLLDLAGLRSGPGRRATVDGVFVEEVDVDQVLAREVERARAGIDASHGHLRSLGLGSLLDMVGRSPGMLETALLSYLDRIRTEAVAGADLVLVDMPPTATAGRILDLAGITRSWLEELLRLRKRIVSLRSSVERIRNGSDPGPDRILERLEGMVERYRETEEWIEQHCAAVIVAGSREVMVREAESVARRPILARYLVWNKGDSFEGALPDGLIGLEQVLFPDLGPSPDGSSLRQGGRSVGHVLVEWVNRLDASGRVL